MLGSGLFSSRSALDGFRRSEVPSSLGNSRSYGECGSDPTLNDPKPRVPFSDCIRALSDFIFFFLEIEMLLDANKGANRFWSIDREDVDGSIGGTSEMRGLLGPVNV